MEETKKIVMYGIAGAAIGTVLGIIKCKSSSSSSSINYNKLLDFKPEFFNTDPTCAQLFLKLQHKANTGRDFENAGSAADSILCLSNELSKGKTLWKSKHAKEVVAYYRKLIDCFENMLDYEKKWLCETPVQHLNRLSEDDKERERLIQRIKDGQQTISDIYDIQEEIRQHLKQYVWYLTRDPSL